MKKKIIKILGIILGILLLIFIVWKIITYEEKYFNKFDFNKNHTVFNMTDIDYLDTIIHSGLQSIKIDNIIVVIKPMIDKKNLQIPDNINIKAYIIGEGIQYIIYIDKMSKNENINVLSHELIYLEQYYTKKLIIKKDTIIWDDHIINIELLTYEERPWEKEAFNNQHNLENKMRKILYGK